MSSEPKAKLITPEELVGEEWAEWYRMTPLQRWEESSKLWQIYLALGGSLDPEPDTQSPFFEVLSDVEPAPKVFSPQILKRSGV